MRNKRVSFTEEEVNYIQVAIKDCVSVNDMAEKLNRTYSSVTNKIYGIRQDNIKADILKYKEKRKGIIKQQDIDTHKCKGCVWGTWTETNYKCLLPKCLKGLGNYKKERLLK